MRNYNLENHSRRYAGMGIIAAVSTNNNADQLSALIGKIHHKTMLVKPNKQDLEYPNP